MNPYTQLDDKAFWRKAIADKSMFDIGELWQPKFSITTADAVATYGSCFAQHIGIALHRRGYTWLVTEPASQGCPLGIARDFNYGIFSARTGNIYTTSLLHQWTRWALDPATIPDEIWLRDGRCVDPFRPQIEPNGFATRGELERSRLQAVACFKRSIRRASVFVFTLGLTESWFHASAGYEYPMCPGTIAGEFSADTHRFVNQRFAQVRGKLVRSLENLRAINPKVRVILTVSPVPLTATASGKHVLVATMHSKSILRAVAADLTDELDYVDYFPSYEIINGTPFQGAFFEPNKRSVHPAGVDFVMDRFFEPLRGGERPARRGAKRSASAAERTVRSAEVCEEALLDAFGDRE